MQRPTIVLATLLAASGLLLACDNRGGAPGNGETVDITGKSNEESAALVADAICEWYAECGLVSVECESTSGGGTQCEGHIYPIRHSDCYPEFYDEILTDFECVDLTPSEEQLVSTCITAFVNQECYTQADVDALMAELEAGGDDDDFMSLPPECMQMAQIFDRCHAVATSPEPAPGR